MNNEIKLFLKILAIIIYIMIIVCVNLLIGKILGFNPILSALLGYVGAIVFGLAWNLID